MLPGRRSLPMTSRVRAALASEVERLAPARAPFPAIDPVLIAIGPFAIRWYALAYIAGIVLGWRLVRRLVQRPGWALTPEAIDDLVLRHTGRHPGRAHRLRAVLSAGHYLTQLDMLAVWRGGMSFHGGLIGVWSRPFCSHGAAASPSSS